MIFGSLKCYSGNRRLIALRTFLAVNCPENKNLSDFKNGFLGNLQYKSFGNEILKSSLGTLLQNIIERRDKLATGGFTTEFSL